MKYVGLKALPTGLMAKILVDIEVGEQPSTSSLYAMLADMENLQQTYEKHSPCAKIGLDIYSLFEGLGELTIPLSNINGIVRKMILVIYESHKDIAQELELIYSYWYQLQIAEHERELEDRASGE